MPSALLTCHPTTPCEAIEHFRVSVHRNGRQLSLEYRIEGDVADLEIPAAGPSHRADGLWRDTCLEAFVKASTGAPAYYEFNFSPSAEWAMYRFADYRQGMANVENIQPPKIALSRGCRQIVLAATVELSVLSLEGDGLRLALAAVIRERSGRLSYWACVHPPGKADFHHPDSFALTLDRQG